MIDVLPTELHYSQIACLPKPISGVINKDKFNRTKELFDLLSDVSVELSFEKKVADGVVVYCHVSASTMMKCQRCLEQFELVIEKTSELLVSESASHGHIDDTGKNGRDIFFVNNGKLSVLGLIEDELLLAVPMIPKHEDLHLCGSFDSRQKGNQARNLRKPFSGLREMLDREYDN
jgi:uncharacterized protein